MACVIKKDSEVEKAFWNESKARLRAGIEPEDVIRDIAKQHGLGTDAVGAILSNRGGLFQLTNEAWAAQAKLSELRSAAKRAIQSADRSPITKMLMWPYEATRRSLTVGHGGVIPFTHARSSLYTPGEARIFTQAVRDAYSYVTPNTGSARWRADMATLRSDPKFNFWSRAGLEIKLQSRPVGMGMSRWTNQSFDALKPMRLKLAKKYWEQLDPADRTLEQAQDLAKRINHATGTVKSPPIVNKIAGATMFAPKLRFAKYASGIADPLTSRFAAKRFAKLAAVNIGLLAVNDLFNRYVLQSDDKVNWTNPGQADWLRMKIAGLTIPMAPMFETARLPIRLGTTLVDPSVRDKWGVAGREIASAAHPGINAIYGGVTGKDLATGRNLPFQGLSQRLYGDKRSQKPMPSGESRTISKGEYAAGYIPIPLQPVVKEMAKQGVAPDVSEKFIHAYIESILSGAGGTHAYPTVPYKPKTLDSAMRERRANRVRESLRR
jgi:hypothetical protein